MLTFDSPTHIYTLDGVVVPSVTTILRRAGVVDFDDVPPMVLERARERGSIVHQAIHYWNENDLDVELFRSDYPEHVGYLEGWIDFCAQRHFQPVLNEHRVASRRHQVAGTLDCLGVLGSKAVLLDFATGRPDDAGKDLQTAAYLSMAIEWSSDDARLAAFLERYPVVHRYAVALRVDGPALVEPYDDNSDFRKFWCLAEAQRIVDARRRQPARERVA